MEYSIKRTKNVFEGFDGIFSCWMLFLSGWVAIFWFYSHWDFFPNWAPIPDATGMNLIEFFAPVLICGYGIISICVFIVTLYLAYFRIRGQERVSVFGFINLVVFSISVFLWVFGPKIEVALLGYAVRRYDQDINAIERYKQDHGEYPSSLNDLVPGYLNSTPGIYLT